MQKLETKMLSRALSLAAAALVALSPGIVAQGPGEPAEPAPAQEQRQTAPAERTVPQVTGTVKRWTGNRIDLETADGKVQKVAVNKETERLVEIETGTEVTVEYRREISGFIIAERVLPAQETAPNPDESGNGSE